MPRGNWTGSPDEENGITGGEDDQYDYYYYDYDDADDGGVHWPYLAFDVLLGMAVLVDLLLVVVVLSGSKLRRGPSAVFIISLAGFDLLHLVFVRLGLYAIQHYEMHSAGHLICKVTSYFVFLPHDTLHASALTRPISVADPVMGGTGGRLSSPH